MAMVLIFAGTLAQARMGVWQVVDEYFRSFFVWMEISLPLSRGVPGTQTGVTGMSTAIPFPGGFLISALLVVNLLAAHALRFRMAKRRIGIMILHAGLIVLLAGEFVTGIFADEGLMSIDEGSTANYVEDVRAVELAISDFSDPKGTRVARIPESLVVAAAESDEQLQPLTMPFTVKVDKWLPNARLLRATGETIGSHGIALEAEPQELPRARGVDGAQTDSPAAYVTLSRGSDTIGTWLLWSDLIDPQEVTVDGRRYGIALRYRRTYKPYSIQLIDFRHDKFVGTEIPRNFSSRVRILDPEHGTDREVVISMNNPLRYRGDTFYQASYKPDGSGTVLQVVRNPGAVLPYIACILVGGGMLYHFVLGLLGFLRRQKAKSAAETEALPVEGAPARERLVLRAVPWAGAALAVLIAFSALLRPQPSSPFDLESFAALPVSAHGRVKPMDTAARHVLKLAGGRESLRTEEGTISAADFMLRLMADPESISDIPVVRIDHPDVLALLGVEPEPRTRVTLGVIQQHWNVIGEQAARAMQVQARERDLFQRSVIELHDRVNALLEVSSMVAPYVVPPLQPREEWRPFHEAYVAARSGGAEFVQDLAPGVAYYIAMMTSFSQGDANTFGRAVAGFESLLERQMPAVMRKARFEVWFNHAAPFLGTTAAYLLAFLVLASGMLLRPRSSDGAELLRRAAVGMLWGAFIVHTFAIVSRIWIQGRPPVTNLYSSAIFVGWAAVLTALFLERTFRLGFAALCASIIGFLTLIVAHNLGSDGDTMQMMQAVLDSNFWLATHVITITLGYSATYLAGCLAIVYLLLGVFTKRLTSELGRSLTRMVYGVVCFALLLSFVGTVLGGIWADQSWGRFWGWDPKENGAALVVLISAIILHARWGGLVGPRGIMVLAVSGNIVTAWSWFGTNMLGVGLHSYGFMDSAAMWLLIFVISQLAVMTIGLTPLAVWRSPASISLRNSAKDS
jgi:ABC-type transport system involved in cytochrome c biogenesis permease subunit